MQRLALEAVVAAKSAPLRVISTHLEYYSPAQRMAQVDALLRLHQEACAHARAPRAADDRPGGSFDVVPRPASAIVCGDFNFKPNDLERARITAPLASGVPRLVDAWSVAHPGEAHAPTVGVHEKTWPLYCCDFVFLTEDLAPRVRAVTVDVATDASDHQPMILEVAD
jgi:endonuclease/exonuclease/phosphatase family metal-dependent hydrolase